MSKPQAKSPSGSGGQNTQRVKSASQRQGNNADQSRYPYFLWVPSPELIRELIKKAITIESVDQLNIEKMREKVQAEGKQAGKKKA